MRKKALKEIVLGLTVGAIMAVAFYVFCFDWSGVTWKDKELYVLNGTYYEGYFVDEDGECWCCDADIPFGESVEVIMSDNGTPTDFYDDVVVQIKGE